MAHANVIGHVRRDELQPDQTPSTASHVPPCSGSFPLEVLGGSDKVRGIPLFKKVVEGRVISMQLVVSAETGLPMRRGASPDYESPRRQDLVTTEALLRYLQENTNPQILEQIARMSHQGTDDAQNQ
jgi:hypothetical protein